MGGGMNGIVRIKAARSPWGEDIQLLICQGGQHGRPLSVATTMKMWEPPPDVIVEPTCRMGLNDVQELMDALWQCALRPSEGTGSAGALAATQKHLEDMRAIALPPYRTQAFVEARKPPG